MEPVKYSNRDAKIIKDNPGKSPYELQSLGLSNKGFERYMAQQSTGADVVADPSLEEDEVTAQPPLPGSTTSDPSNDPEVEDDEDDDEDESPAPVKPQTAPLIPKITKIQEPETFPSPVKLLPNQVVVKAPNGRTNTMGREFAQKLVKADPKYKIIS